MTDDDSKTNTARVWRLDELDPEAIRPELYRIADFVDWLHTNEVEVPKCWYVHGWLRHRLAAFLASWDAVSSGQEATRWWADLWSARQSDEWRQADGHGGRHSNGRHEDVRTPALKDVVDELVTAAREAKHDAAAV